MPRDSRQRPTTGSLPEYSVRVSARARRVRLVLNMDGGLEVVVPRRFDQSEIGGLLEGRREWIERASERIRERAEARRRRLEADPPRLPERIVLAAAGEQWEVEYRPRAASTTGRTEPSGAPGTDGVHRAVARERRAGRLVVTGDLEDHPACKAALGRWLSRKARKVLVPWLEALAEEHGFKHGRVSVRRQRTRWASCSRRGAVSLNARLLFLPGDVVDYVMLHELCHTVEMNHSPRFWTLLGYHDPRCRAHRKTLSVAWSTLPTWLDHEVEDTGL